MTASTVVLFDIDGTLVSTGGAGRRAIDLAFARLHGRADACSHFSFDGMTDRAIARLGLQAIGAPSLAPDIDAVLTEYVRCLELTVQETTNEQYVVHDGVRAAVQACVERGWAVGLGTGNVREGARLKLERVDLYRWFAFGGFGDDSESRAELIRAGVARGAERLGLGVTSVRVVIVGDTPKDVEAARANHAMCLGVGTGAWAADQLVAAGATDAVSSLGAVGALDRLRALGER